MYIRTAERTFYYFLCNEIFVRILHHIRRMAFPTYLLYIYLYIQTYIYIYAPLYIIICLPSVACWFALFVSSITEMRNAVCECVCPVLAYIYAFMVQTITSFFIQIAACACVFIILIKKRKDKLCVCVCVSLCSRAVYRSRFRQHTCPLISI